ncbi:WD40 repeat-like protein [Rhizopogon salebrosus TDB-379]|nr:WD40 repeat-like protein [Rhizopogon salebrosus TDB-379]
MPWKFKFKNLASTQDTGLRNIYVIDYSHDGRQLIVSGYGSNVSVLAVKKRELVLDRVIKVCSDPDQVSWATWARTADGHAVVTGSTNGEIKMHSSEPSRSLLHEWGDFQGHSICAIVQSPDKRILLASVLYGRTLRLLDLKAKRLIGQPLQHSAELSCAAFAAGGTLLATGTRDGKIYVWRMLDLLSESETTRNIMNVHHTDGSNEGVNTGLTNHTRTPSPSGGEPASPSFSRTSWTSFDTLHVDNNEYRNTPKGGTGGARRWPILRHVIAQVVAAARTLQSLGQKVARTRTSEIVDAPRNEA